MIVDHECINEQGEFEAKFPFSLRDYQQEFLFSKKRRSMLIWSARSGKDITCLYKLQLEALLYRGNYAYVFPLMRDAYNMLINGTFDDHRRMLPWFFPEFYIARKSEKSGYVLELINGSYIFICGCDNAKGKNLVGKTWDGIIVSEFGLMNSPSDLFSAVLPRLNKATGWIVLNTTPRGSVTFTYETWLAYQQDPLAFASFVTADNYMTQKEIDDYVAVTGMDEFTVRRELYCDFFAPIHGAIYGRELRDVHHSVIDYVGGRPIYAAFDVGFSDYTSVWLFQKITRDRINIIDFYSVRQTGMDEIIEDLKQLTPSSFNAILPHDAGNRVRGDARFFYSAGISVHPLYRTPSKEMDIHKVREFMRKNTLVWNDTPTVKKGIELMKMYRRNDHGNIVHGNDGSSDAADAFRYMAIFCEEYLSMDEGAVCYEY